MKALIAIFLREFRSTLATPFSFVILAAYVFLASFFFLGTLSYYNTQLYNASLLGQQIQGVGEWVITPFLKTLEIVFIFICPVLCMRAFPEERRNSTFEMLLTAPVSAAAIVWGKFLALGSQLLVLVGTAALLPLALAVFLPLDILPVLVGLFGLWLFGLALSGLGLMISALARNQTTAGFVAFVFSLIWYVSDAPAGKLQGPAAELLRYLAPSSHNETFFRGVLASGELIYFLSAIGVGLFFTVRALEAERFR